MATREQAQRLARRRGARLLTDPDRSHGEVLAPPGTRWLASGDRCYAVSFGYRGAMSLVYDDLIEAMRDGLEELAANEGGHWHVG